MTNEERIRELIKNAEKFDGLSFIKERIANREQIRKEKRKKLKELMTNETKQTAVDVFSEKVFNSIELLKRGWVNQEDFLNGLIEFRDEAKELERSQHIKTWEAGLLKVDFNDYINETYGGNNEK